MQNEDLLTIGVMGAVGYFGVSWLLKLLGLKKNQEDLNDFETELKKEDFQEQENSSENEDEINKRLKKLEELEARYRNKN